MRLHFDRGTVILTGQLPSELARLCDIRWDPRVGAYRAPAYRLGSLLAALTKHGYRVDNDVSRARVACAPWRPIELRPYQQAALSTWRKQERGLIVMPTGSGKTRVACAVMAACAAPALCLVPTRALLHQFRGEIAKYYSGPIGLLGDGAHVLEAVTVATFESAYRNMSRVGNLFDLLVVDEVHHFGVGVRDEALEMCTAPRRLALTATAPEGRALARVHELMGPPICSLSVADLSGLWLADFESVVLSLRLNRDEQVQYEFYKRRFCEVFEAFRAWNREAGWRDFTKFAASSEAGRAALVAFRASRQITSYPEAKRAALASLLAEHRGQRVLVFTSDNATAYAIAREQLIMPITCDIDREERSQALRAFRTGELRALVSAQVLNEGIDVPDAEIAIIVGGLRGQREHVQRVGRLLRPRPGKRAIIYELVMEDTHEVRKAAERRKALQPGRTRRA